MAPARRGQGARVRLVGGERDAGSRRRGARLHRRDVRRPQADAHARGLVPDPPGPRGAAGRRLAGAPPTDGGRLPKGQEPEFRRGDACVAGRSQPLPGAVRRADRRLGTDARPPPARRRRRGRRLVRRQPAGAGGHNGGMGCRRRPGNRGATRGRSSGRARAGAQGRSRRRRLRVARRRTVRRPSRARCGRARRCDADRPRQPGGSPSCSTTESRYSTTRPATA